MADRKEKAMGKEMVLVSVERIEQMILSLRGQKVILDKDLASLYEVSTSNLNKAVSRNLDRFPKDFMFQLSAVEFNDLKFHFGTSSLGRNAQAASRFHGARGCHAFQRTSKFPSCAGEH